MNESILTNSATDLQTTVPYASNMYGNMSNDLYRNTSGSPKAMLLMMQSMGLRKEFLPSNLAGTCSYERLVQSLTRNTKSWPLQHPCRHPVIRVTSLAKRKAMQFKLDRVYQARGYKVVHTGSSYFRGFTSQETRKERQAIRHKMDLIHQNHNARPPTINISVPTVKCPRYQ